MVRRACYDEVGLYNLNLISSDHEMWLRILLFTKWRISFVNKPLALYRRYGSNVSLNLSRVTNLQRSLSVLKEALCKFDKAERSSDNYKLVKEEIEKKNAS